MASGGFDVVEAELLNTAVVGVRSTVESERGVVLQRDLKAFVRRALMDGQEDTRDRRAKSVA